MKRLILSILALIPSLCFADSVSFIDQEILPKILKESLVFKTAISTRKGTAHIFLKRIKIDSEVSYFEGTVNNSDLVSGVSDGDQVILYFTLRGVNFMYQSTPNSKLYSRKSLSKICGTKTKTSLIKASHSVSKAKLPTHLRLSIVIDRSGARKIGSDLNTKVKAIVSRINQIYRSNLSISVKRIETIQMKSDLSSSDIESLLNTFQRRRSTVGISSNARAAHLITGKNLEDDGVIGLAYLASICRYNGRYKFGVSQFISRSFQPTLIAHEIGHNLNASHSDDGIMQAVLIGPLSTFSEDSKNEIGAYVSQFGSCLN